MESQALRSLAEFPEQPCWLEPREDDPPASEMIAFPNALVHALSSAHGLRAMEPTPRFFNANAVDYDFDANAPEPIRWLEFLGARPLAKGSPIEHQLWADDPASIDCLQEWLGLMLVPVTKFQKIMALLGPKRAGKGTIIRILTKMTGKANVVGLQLRQFENQFGMQSLVGKLVGIVDDARLSSHGDTHAVAENLLSISGEGRFSIPRKYLSDWEGRLPTRLTILSNELPRIPDSSGALASRLLILRFTQSFADRENADLDDILAREIPSILLWALQGLDRLMKRGRFIQPESGMELKEDFEDLGSPIGTFVRERCVVEANESIPKSVLYDAWKQWCEANGRKEPGEISTFSRNLRSVIPNLGTKRPGTGEDRTRAFKGVSLLPAETETPPSELEAADFDHVVPPGVLY
jgi:putative DNA primase/helicase